MLLSPVLGTGRKRKYPAPNLKGLKGHRWRRNRQGHKEPGWGAEGGAALCLLKEMGQQEGPCPEVGPTTGTEGWGPQGSMSAHLLPETSCQGCHLLQRPLSALCALGSCSGLEPAAPPASKTAKPPQASCGCTICFLKSAAFLFVSYAARAHSHACSPKRQEPRSQVLTEPNLLPASSYSHLDLSPIWTKSPVPQAMQKKGLWQKLA